MTKNQDAVAVDVDVAESSSGWSWYTRQGTRRSKPRFNHQPFVLLGGGSGSGIRMTNGSSITLGGGNGNGMRMTNGSSLVLGGGRGRGLRVSKKGGEDFASPVSDSIFNGGGPASTNGLSEHSDIMLGSNRVMRPKGGIRGDSTTRLDALLRLASTFFLNFAKYLEINSSGILARGSHVRSYGPAHLTRNSNLPRLVFR